MARLRAGSPSLLRDLNRTSILALIGMQGPIARVEIARQLSLSPATVTVLTRDLLQEGLIREVAAAPSRGGRPGVLLGLVGGAAHALGVKIAPDRLTFVRVGLDGQPLGYSSHSFDALAPDAADRLLTELQNASSSAPDDSQLLGIGLGLPGIVDSLTEGAVASPVFGWDALPLGSRIEEQLGVPVLIDNDVNTLAVAERLFGRGRAVDHFITITIGRGVGLGIVVAGDLYRGYRGGAGEFGHVRVAEDGPLCYCGGIGCLETLVADPALVDRARARGVLVPGEGVEQLYERAQHGHQGALQVLAAAGATLGRAAAGLVNVLSPQLVLISGEGVRGWPFMAASFEAALRPHLFGPLRDVTVEVDPWDDAKWAQGAAALVLRAMFRAPIYERRQDQAVRDRLSLVTPPAAGVA